MQFNLAGLKELRTTIPGLIMIGGATYALIKGMCTFEQWYQVVGLVILLLGGAGAVLANTKSKEEEKK